MILANEAAEALRSAFNLLQKELGQKLSQVDEVDAIFTWEGKDYRVSLQPYDEPLLPKQKAARKRHGRQAMASPTALQK